MTVLENETIEHLDFEPKIECDEKECSNRAAWVVRRTCCDVSPLLCDFHKKSNDEFAKRYIKGATVTCTACGTSGLVYNKEFWYEPL